MACEEQPGDSLTGDLQPAHASDIAGRDAVGQLDGQQPGQPSPSHYQADSSCFFRCSLCNSDGFVSKRRYYDHLRTEHDVSKPFACSICKKLFPYSSSLYNHLKTHSPVRPYACDHCSATFRWKLCLQQHVKSAHAKHVDDSSCARNGNVSVRRKNGVVLNDNQWLKVGLDDGNAETSFETLAAAEDVDRSTKRCLERNGRHAGSKGVYRNLTSSLILHRYRSSRLQASHFPIGCRIESVANRLQNIRQMARKKSVATESNSASPACHMCSVVLAKVDAMSRQLASLEMLLKSFIEQYNGR